MAEELLRSLPTELWYPYGEPGRTHDRQDYEGIGVDFANNENYLANSPDTPRPDGVAPGP